MSTYHGGRESVLLSSSMLLEKKMPITVEMSISLQTSSIRASLSIPSPCVPLTVSIASLISNPAFSFA